MGWIFQGNPKWFDVDDYLSRYPSLLYWRTPKNAGSIALGDRMFVWRAGTESGVVAIGKVVELPVPACRVAHPECLGDDLWVSTKPDAVEPKTGLEIEELRLSIDEGMVLRRRVMMDPALKSSAIITARVGTVFRLSDEQTRALENLWGASAGAGTATVAAEEGERRLRSHYTRERSRRLRRDKLEEFRRVHRTLYCEICGESELERYPWPGRESIFEIHHRAPLSKATSPVRTTLADLAVLCANCHTYVHSTKCVDENYDRLVTHFSALL